MDIKEMVYRFKMGINKLDTHQKPDFRPNQIIIYLNDAQDKLVEADYAVDPRNKMGFETVQKRIDDLSNLHVTFETLRPAPIKEGVVGFDLRNLKHRYLHVTRRSFVGSKSNCRDQVLTDYNVQTDDLNEILKDPDKKPSFEWREIPTRIAGNFVQAFYTDFEILGMEVDYLRYPNYMDIAGYVHFNRAPSANVDCEMNRMYQLKIIDKAVELASMDMNSNTINIAQAKTTTNPV